MKKPFSVSVFLLLCSMMQSQPADNAKNLVSAAHELEKEVITTNFLFASRSREEDREIQSYSQPTIRPQNIYRIESVFNNKTVEVEDGLFEKGKKVQQCDGYARNGIVDGKNQEWLLIPAGSRDGQTVYYIINNGFLKYLDVVTAENGGAHVIDGNDGDNQLWILQPSGQPSIYFIRSFVARQCMQTSLTNRDNRVALEFGAFTGGENQQFRFIQFSDTGPIGYQANSHVNICPKFNANKTINIANAATQNGASIELYNIINGAANEHWKIVGTPDGYYKIHSDFTDKCIDVTGWEAGNNSNLVSWDIAEVEKQKWLIVPVARKPGYFIFFNKVSGKCIDVANASSVNGTIVQTFTFANQDNQKWKLLPAR